MKISIVIATLAINLVYGQVSSNCSGTKIKQQLFYSTLHAKHYDSQALKRFTNSAESATNQLGRMLSITEFGFKFEASF